jgi:hypothetical protein
LGEFALLRCSLEIDALCRRCQLAEKRMHTPPVTPWQSETSR